MPIKNNAFTAIPNQLKACKNLTEDEIIPKPSNFFKIDRLKNPDIENKTIRITVRNQPTSLMADGCTTNISALRQLSENIGFLSLTIRCVSHAVDCSIKRKRKCKPMNVEVSEPILTNFRIIISHLQLSCKSLAILTESLKALEMRPLHLMPFCPTPLSYLLPACKQAVNL